MFDAVDQFTYIGSVIPWDGLCAHDVQSRISKASRVFGCLQAHVFRNRPLFLRCRRDVYVALVLTTLLYGAETWTTKAPDLRRLNAFHHQCVRAIVDISRHQQWDDRVTSSTLAKTLFLYYTGIQVENKKKRGKGQNIGDVGTTC